MYTHDLPMSETGSSQYVSQTKKVRLARVPMTHVFGEDCNWESKMVDLRCYSTSIMWLEIKIKRSFISI